MRQFNDSIEKLNKELQEFIHKYEALDYHEPFNTNIFNGIKALFEENYHNSLLATTSLYKHRNNIDNLFDSMLKNHHKETTRLKKELKNTKSEIKKGYEEKINDLNTEINLSKKQNIQDKKDKQLDIEFYITSSEQYLDMFESEYKDNTNRFTYQYSVAKESYNNNIIHYNNILEAQLNKLDKEFGKSLNEYDNDTQKIINAYNTAIENDQFLLEKKNNDFKASMLNYKERRRNETKALNDAIRSLQDNKDIKIGEARAFYTSSQNNSNIEKENKRQKNHQESQKIARDFAFNINELDDANNAAKEKLIKETEYLENRRKEVLENYDIQLNRELDSSSDDKKIIKRYNTLKSDELKSVSEEIERLNEEYNYEIAKNAYAKKLLNLDRTIALKRLTELETKDNKYYQEIDNQYENSLSYNIQAINSSFTKDANQIRLDSTINSMEVNRNIAELEATYEKQFEVLNNNIKKNKLEIDVALRINKLMHEFEDKKYQRKINFLTVSCLLEIEKCKVLDTYNKTQYELNITNYKNILDYSKNKIQLQNEKYEKLENQKLKINDKKLENLIHSTGYRIMELSINEGHEYRYLDRQNEHQLESLALNILYERFKCELKEMHFVLSTLVLLIRYLENITSKTIDYILDNIIFRPEYQDLLRVFLKEFVDICSSYFINIIKDYTEIETSIIDNRIKFEEDFKFNEYYSQLKSKYDSNLTALNIEKTSIYREIEDTNNKIEDTRTQIFRLESSINYQKYNGTTNRKEVSTTKKRINVLYNDIKILNEDLVEHNNSINIIDKKLSAIESKYVEDLNKIKQLQYKNAQSYHELKDKILEYTSSIINEINDSVNSDNSEEITYENHNDLLSSRRDTFIENNTNNLNNLYGIYNVFSTKTSSALESLIDTTNNDYEKDVIKINNLHEDKISDCKNDFERINRKQLLEIRRLEYEYDSIERNYQRIEKTNDNKYNKSIKQVILDKKESTNQFYIELYAISDNLKDIQIDYEEYLKESTKEFEDTKTNIIQEALQKKKDFNNDLAEYIRVRNELIKQLPIQNKIDAKNLILENKETNKEIDAKLSELKSQYNERNKQIKKNLSMIESTYQSNIDKIDSDQRKAINKEKKIYNSELRKNKMAQA